MFNLDKLAEQNSSIAFDIVRSESGFDYSAARYVFDSLNCAVSGLSIEGFNLVASNSIDHLMRLNTVANWLLPPEPEDVIKEDQETAAEYVHRVNILEPILRMNVYIGDREESVEIDGEHDEVLKAATGLAAVVFEEILETVGNHSPDSKTTEFDAIYHNLEFFWINVSRAAKQIRNLDAALVSEAPQQDQYSTLQHGLMEQETRLKEFKNTLPENYAREFGAIFGPEGQEQLQYEEDQEGKRLQFTIFGMMPAFEDMKPVQRYIYFRTEAYRETEKANEMEPGETKDYHLLEASRYRIKAREAVE
jgi:hypothetical protein